MLIVSVYGFSRSRDWLKVKTGAGDILRPRVLFVGLVEKCLEPNTNLFRFSCDRSFKSRQHSACASIVGGECEIQLSIARLALADESDLLLASALLLLSLLSLLQAI